MQLKWYYDIRTVKLNLLHGLTESITEKRKYVVTLNIFELVAAAVAKYVEGVLCRIAVY